ncbi:MAG: glycerophosphoryl diester phosphodiesterase [Ilumatobacteraceae bacterium]|nr:glycerophosphoryl diester phosphodiesterase [Ilumatobacteraceae bacterium]
MTEVLAHRGASMVAPENTVEAFRRAKTLGSDAVELDVRRTADGVLVVHHEARLADGRVIAETDAVDLPTWLPDLAAALDACAGMWVNVEIKNDANDPDFDPTDRIADQTLALLTARHEDDRWLVSSFRLETIDRCKALCPEIRTAWLVDHVPDDVIATLVARRHEALHPWVGFLLRSHIDACHGAGIEVNAWTCDDPERMAELIEWGIDGICTNVPDVALAVIARCDGSQVAEG